MDYQEVLYILKRKVRRIFKKTKKFCKRTWRKFVHWLRWYIRLLIRHTKAKDYSVLIYTITALIVFILVISLIGKAFSSLGHKDKKKEVEPTTEIVTPVEPTMTDAEREHQQLVSQSKIIYDNNKDFLILVNDTHPLDEDYTFEHHTLNSGYDIDERIFNDLVNMLTDLNNEDLHYSIVSGYRSRQYQQSLIDNDVATYMNQGMSQEEAYELTIQSVQLPGCSEHETGLALDITSEGIYELTENIQEYETIQWLTENCHKYGFILRYPKDKVSSTGIKYEPWHFRYVGLEAAAFLQKNNLSLEEFYELLGK